MSSRPNGARRTRRARVLGAGAGGAALVAAFLGLGLRPATTVTAATSSGTPASAAAVSSATVSSADTTSSSTGGSTGSSTATSNQTASVTPHTSSGGS